MVCRGIKNFRIKTSRFSKHKTWTVEIKKCMVKDNLINLNNQLKSSHNNMKHLPSLFLLFNNKRLQFNKILNLAKFSKKIKS